MSSIEGAVGVTETLDNQEVDYLGHVCWATTGDVIVPREWLVERFEQIPGGKALIPNKTWPSSAYKLAVSHLIKPKDREKWINGHEVTFRIVDGDKGNYRHLFADVLFTEEECGQEGGMVQSHKLATYNYVSEEATPKNRIMVDKEEQPALFQEAVYWTNKMMRLWNQMKESHHGQDLRQVFMVLREDESNAIPLRHAGAVYFFPAQYAGTVEGLATVWDELNQFKDDGHEMEIATIPLIDNEGHREMVRRHAEQMLQKRIDDVVEAGLEQLDDSDDETASEIAEEVVEELGESVGLAQEYSTLLETKLTIKRHIQDWLGEVESEKEELVREVLDADEIEL